MNADRHGVADEAARIVCEEALTDYRQAKLKALDRLGLPPRTPLPDNASVQAAVLSYLRVFGGEAHAQWLQQLRRTAVAVLRALAPFEPRLVGAVVSGAVTTAHRVQIHAFADQAESVDIFLLDRQVDFDVEERRYRYPGGREVAAPVLRFDWHGIGVDVAIFDAGARRQAPINPADGQPYRRLDLAAAEALLQASLASV
ncbi:MAG TPA: hypothetical protein VGE57_13240 [Solimonas sp.]